MATKKTTPKATNDSSVLHILKQLKKKYIYLILSSEINVQVNLIITLSLESIETNGVISEPCYNEVIYYRHIAN